MARGRSTAQALKLHRLLGRMGTELNQPVKDALAAAAREIRDAAIGLAPVRTGRLREALKAKGTRAGWSWQVGIVQPADRRDVFYAVFQEYGTRQHPAHPFLGPAFNRHRGAAADNITREVNRALDRMVRGL